MAAMNRIPYEQRVKTYQEAIEHYGNAHQTIKAIEEMSELTKELCKLLNPDTETTMERIAEEIADVIITLEQLQIIYCLNRAVRDYMDAKIERLHMMVLEHLYRAQ